MLALQRFKDFITEHHLFEVNDKILIAVSGGKDSVLMAHLFKQAGFNFGIAHCNFGLRSTESDLDEKLTLNLAKKLNVRFHTVKFQTTEYSKENNISIQMAARELRYTWFEKIRNEQAYHYIALAHHKDDTVETLLLNLVRGTGISGLHGILPKRDFLIRPLLFLFRDEIDHLIKTENIRFRDDQSNFSSKYARNKIRLKVIPVLKEINPSIEHTLSKAIDYFALMEGFLTAKINEVRKHVLKEVSPEEFHLLINELTPEVKNKFALYELLKAFHFKETAINDILKSLEKHAGRIFYSATHTATLDRKVLIIRRTEPAILNEVIINRGQTLAEWENKTFSIKEVLNSNFNLATTKNIAQIDYDLLQFPLKLRSWKEGDYFYPLGMKNQKKKISDFFINQKIAISSKNKIALLENLNGDIIWISGYRIDNRYKITNSTQKIVTLELQTDHGK